MISSSSLHVQAPSMLATVQDCGRHGVAHLGVSPSGAVDWFSARAANLLVGNDACAAVLEITLTGAAFEARGNIRVAITGASAPLTIDGRAAATWRSHDVAPGTRIAIGPAERGARSYLAAAGGLDVPLVLGSASTDLGGGFGGFGGRAVRAGDTLPLLDVAHAGRPQLAYSPECIPHWTPSSTLRILTGPHLRLLSADARAALLQGTFTVSSRSTRQGLALEGEALPLDQPTDVISAGVCSGCVQITSAGLPVVLLAEHQTTGGYATVACVTTADLPRAGQLRAGDHVRFEMVTQTDAAYALVSMKRMLGASVSASVSE